MIKGPDMSAVPDMDWLEAIQYFTGLLQHETDVEMVKKATKWIGKAGAQVSMMDMVYSNPAKTQKFKELIN